MSVERTAEGLRIRLKSRGVGRFVSAAFLAFWLCIWGVGEAIVLGIVIIGGKALLTGRPPEPGRDPLDPGPALMVGVFLIVWLTMWTIGGIAALGELVRLLWAEDRFAVSMDRLTITWVRGPFRSVRSYEQDTIRRISLVGRQEHLALEDTSQGTVTSGLGSRAERVEAATVLRTELHVPETPPVGTVIPRAWEEIITPEGERALAPNLSTRRAQARVAGVVTMALAAVTFLLMRESIRRFDLVIAAVVLLAFTVSLGAGTVWLARGRSEWRIERQRLTLRKRFGSSVRDVFEARRLLIDSDTDSDGDPWYVLYAIGDGDAEARPRPPAAAIQWRSNAAPRNSRTVARVMSDASSVRDLAVWLSRATGLSLEDRTTPQAREAQLAELRSMLDQSGRFGRWVMKLIDHLSKDRKNHE